MKRTIELLLRACQTAGVDPELIFEHFDEADLCAYRDALADGSVRHEDLPRWMESTAATIRDGRCLCRACKGVKA
jgi:hypothetical protein